MTRAQSGASSSDHSIAGDRGPSIRSYRAPSTFTGSVSSISPVTLNVIRCSLTPIGMRLSNDAELTGFVAMPAPDGETHES